jgi:hypothetical protein
MMLNDFSTFESSFLLSINKYYEDGNKKKVLFMKPTIEFLRLILINLSKMHKIDILNIVQIILTNEEFELLKNIDMYMLFFYQSIKLIFKHIINDITTIPLSKISNYIEDNIYTPWDLKYTLLSNPKYQNLIVIAKDYFNDTDNNYKDNNDNFNNNFNNDNNENFNNDNKCEILLPVIITIDETEYKFYFTKELTIGLLISNSLPVISPFVVKESPFLKDDRYEKCLENKNFKIKLFTKKFNFFDKFQLPKNFQNPFSDDIKFYSNPYVINDKFKVLLYGVNISDTSYSFNTKDFFQGFINGANWRNLDYSLYYKELIQFYDLKNFNRIDLQLYI